MLTGRLGAPNNTALFQRAKRLSAGKHVWPSMPAYFRQHGYTTVSVGKVSHHPGGLGGADWNDPLQPEMPQSWDRHLLPVSQWQHPRGWMHGLANGQIRRSGKSTDVFQSTLGDDSIYPDGPSIDESLRQLDELGRDHSKPFFLAVGILRPHLPLGAPAKYFQPYRNVNLPAIPHPEKPAGKTTWHHSGEFHSYNTWQKDPNLDAKFADQVRRHYGACVSYADAQVGKLVNRLKQRGLWDSTIVVLWGDHGWHLGEHAVWGKHTLFEESLRSPLIVRLPDHPGTNVCDQIVESTDLFPTLCVAAGLPKADFATGIAMNDLLDPDPAKGQSPTATRSAFDQKGAISHFKKARTIRTADHRLILHPSGHVELYDHRTTDAETKNVASQHPERVDKLRQVLNQRFSDPYPSKVP
jgi:iduronate 2-sulfatase